MTASLPLLVPQFNITWPRLPDDYILPDDPVENTDHPLLATALRLSFSNLPDKQQNALIVSNFALCAAINNRMICKAPDWMYVQPVEPWNHPYPRRSYTPHTEGPIPTLVMEFLSETYGEEYSVESQQRIGKWLFYEQIIRVPTYVIFQPDTPHLELYRLESGRYQLQPPDETGRYWVPGLDLFLGIWQGSRDNRTGAWLRWWNSEGNLLLWPEEALEQERQRLDAERQRAETERQRAEAAEERAQRLAEQLRQLGINLEDHPS